MIAVAHQKGGVAKTTTTVNLATARALGMGKRVLLIDPDAQAGCALCNGMDMSGLRKTTHNVLIAPGTDLASIITKTGFGLHLAPANIDLAAAELQLKEMMARECVLQRKLLPVLDPYDYTPC